MGGGVSAFKLPADSFITETEAEETLRTLSYVEEARSPETVWQLLLQAMPTTSIVKSRALEWSNLRYYQASSLFMVTWATTTLTPYEAWQCVQWRRAQKSEAASTAPLTLDLANYLKSYAPLGNLVGRCCGDKESTLAFIAAYVDSLNLEHTTELVLEATKEVFINARLTETPTESADAKTVECGYQPFTPGVVMFPDLKAMHTENPLHVLQRQHADFVLTAPTVAVLADQRFPDAPPDQNLILADFVRLGSLLTAGEQAGLPNLRHQAYDTYLQRILELVPTDLRKQFDDSLREVPTVAVGADLSMQWRRRIPPEVLAAAEAAKPMVIEEVAEGPDDELVEC